MDIDYNALYGVDGGNEQEAAEPAGVDDTVTEETEPEQETETEAGEAEETETEPVQEETEKPEQSKEENARFAAARRKAEQERDAAVQKAKAEAEEYIRNSIQAMGLADPKTGKPITTKEELDAYQQSMQEERRQKILRRSGMTEEELRKMVDDMPEVRAAKEAEAKAKAEAEAVRAQRAKDQIEAEIREIGQFDDSVKSLQDLMAQENYAEIYAKVQKGYSLLDAFKVVNMDRINGKAQAAARQSAMNAASGKSHMTGTRSRGEGAVSVPDDVKAEYKIWNPGITDAEIAAHYGKMKRK